MILLLESLHPEAEALLRTADEVVHADTPEAAMAVARGGRVTAMFTRGSGRITGGLIDVSPALRAVSRAGAGVDTIDVAAASARGVTVIYAPGINADTTAEHTLMLMLMITRRALTLAREVKLGNWAVRIGHEGVELRGKTLGIVGMGAIGQAVARRAEAFGMHVRGHSRSSGEPLHAVLSAADVVSVHVPLNASTRGLMNASAFEQLKPGAFLINTARGAVIDKRALRNALDTGQLAGFAGDVFDPQPPGPEDMPLVTHDRVLLTPHVAGLTDATYREVCLYCARNVLAVLTDQTPASRSVYVAQVERDG
jgi:D-3-phosphoglycerate dehydrogenase / 2-oxoglutarate reductase